MSTQRAQAPFRLSTEIAKKAFISAGYCTPNTPIPNDFFVKTLATKEKNISGALYRLNALGLLITIDKSFTIHPLLATYARTFDTNKTYLGNVIETILTLFILEEKND